MFNRTLMVLFLAGIVAVQPITAAPDTSWSQLDPPTIALVADFSPRTGLEGIYWDAFAGELHGVSLADFYDLGQLPDRSDPNDTYLSALDLDDDGYAEVVRFVGMAFQSPYLAAYKHNGTSWTELWRNGAEIEDTNTDLQLIDLNGTKPGSYLMATGPTLQLCDSATGLVVWDSVDPNQGPGPGWALVNWTLANYDQDSGNTDELLVEFNGPFGGHQLLMINESAAVAAAPLQSTIISLGASHPNPMFGATTVQFDLPAPTMVRLNIYDVRGRRVANLAHRTMAAGSHALRWDGNDRDGARVAQGVYFYELKAAGQTRTRKMMVVR